MDYNCNHSYEEGVDIHEFIGTREGKRFNSTPIVPQYNPETDSFGSETMKKVTRSMSVDSVTMAVIADINMRSETNLENNFTKSTNDEGTVNDDTTGSMHDEYYTDIKHVTSEQRVEEENTETTNMPISDPVVKGDDQAFFTPQSSIGDDLDFCTCEEPQSKMKTEKHFYNHTTQDIDNM